MIAQTTQIALTPPSTIELRRCWDGPANQDTINLCLALADRFDQYAAYQQTLCAQESIKPVSMGSMRLPLVSTVWRHKEEYDRAITCASRLRGEAGVIASRLQRQTKAT